MNIIEFLNIDGIDLFSFILKYNINGKRKYLKGYESYKDRLDSINSVMKKRERVRKKYRKEEDLIVPPMLIISVTNDCNLKCRGCYANGQCRSKNEEISIERIDQIVSEGEDLGVSLVLLAGGEPLMKEGLLEMVESHEDTIFVMFTNGTMFSDEVVKKIASIKNLIPIMSLEGDEIRTDYRRGEGVYKKVMTSMIALNSNASLFGTSITVTKQNYLEVTSDEYIKSLKDKGVDMVFWIEYVPEGGDEDRCITDKQKNVFFKKARKLEKKHGILAVPMVGYQDYFGGCLAAGRGFVHISSTGTVEPCPFSPWSDINVKGASLRQALESKFINNVRKNHHLLKGENGGCALSQNPEWALGLLNE